VRLTASDGSPGCLQQGVTFAAGELSLQPPAANELSVSRAVHVHRDDDPSDQWPWRRRRALGVGSTGVYVDDSSMSSLADTVPVMTLGDLQARRHIQLEGCFNVRDVGGYRAQRGATVRWNRLYRAGGPHQATRDDIEVLRSLEITTVIDLRTRDEIRERDGYAAQLAPHASHSLPMTDVLPAETDLARWTDPVFVADHCYTMLTRAPDVVAEALRILTDPSAYPVLIHCSAGKDRTGVLVAIVLGVLGVEEHTIVQDYALSATAMVALLRHFEHAAPEAQERLHPHAPAIRAADPVAMAEFISRLRASHGSFEGYAASLGITSAVPHVRAALLAPQ
jgi:protein-tyrosine phosphatase